MFGLIRIKVITIDQNAVLLIRRLLRLLGDLTRKLLGQYVSQHKVLHALALLVQQSERFGCLVRQRHRAFPPVPLVHVAGVGPIAAVLVQRCDALQQPIESMLSVAIGTVVGVQPVGLLDELTKRTSGRTERVGISDSHCQTVRSIIEMTLNKYNYNLARANEKKTSLIPINGYIRGLLHS